MANVDNATTSLSITARDLDHDAVTALLGCAPTRSFRAGDIRSTRGPDQRWKHGGWFLETTLDREADISAQITDLLDQVTQDVTVWQQIAERFSARIFCGVFMERENEGFSLDPDVLARLVIRKLPIDFDLYGPTQDDGKYQRD
ncbi:MAG: DUF4279 domain-containing protein [Chloroflexi bacterium]|nr:DUF4279 domain-containing protein [Chloroflexota bacterium]